MSDADADGAPSAASGSPRFPWRGDMEDDCTCRTGNLLAHAECLGEIRWKDADERRPHASNHWFVSVSRVGEDGGAIGPDLFHSGEHAGMILGAEMARAIAEAVLSAGDQGGPTTAANKDTKNTRDTDGAGIESTALFGVPLWNPLEHGITDAPLMVPAREYSRVASSLAEALSLALQYVPLTGADADKIRELERAATIPPDKGMSQQPGKAAK